MINKYIVPINFIFCMANLTLINAMEKDPSQKKNTFTAIFNQVKKKNANGWQFAEKIDNGHGHLNPVYGKKLSTKIASLDDVVHGKAEKVKKSLEKHPEIATSPLILAMAVKKYEQEKKLKRNSAEIQQLKNTVGVLFTHCSENEVLQNVVDETKAKGSVRSLAEVMTLVNNGDLHSAKYYFERKHKKRASYRAEDFSEMKQEIDNANGGARLIKSASEGDQKKLNALIEKYK